MTNTNVDVLIGGRELIIRIPAENPVNYNIFKNSAAKPDWVELGWALRIQNRVGLGEVGLKRIKGSAQNYQPELIQLWSQVGPGLQI